MQDTPRTLPRPKPATLDTIRPQGRSEQRCFEAFNRPGIPPGLPSATLPKSTQARPAPATTENPSVRAGLAYALAAYGFWGFAAFYFRAIGHVSPFEILAHRVVWASVLLWGLLTVTRRLPEVREVARSPKILANLALSGALVAVNWLCFVYAIDTGRLLHASLGYFINPLVSVGLGMLFLGERLRPLQLAAVALAVTGVAVQTAVVGELPWIALAVAGTFGCYGLVRKQSPIGPTLGLAVEVALLLPLALAFLALTETLGWSLGKDFAGTAFLNGSLSTSLLLVAAGVVTAFPLVCFTAAAKRLRLSTLGFVQYVAPTAQFLIAVIAFNEPFSTAQAVVFALIWTGVAVFIADSVRTERDRRRTERFLDPEPA